MRTQSQVLSFVPVCLASLVVAVASASSLSIQSATSSTSSSKCSESCDAVANGPCSLICDTQNDFIVEFATANVALTPISITASATADAITLGGRTAAHATSGFDVEFSLEAPSFVYVEWNIFFPVAENNFLTPPYPPDGVWVGQLPAGSYYVRASHDVSGEGALASGIFVRLIPDYFADCDGDGTFDWQEIVAGTQQDANNNGIPDGCEIPGDLNHDGSVGAPDLAIMLGAWGSGGEADLDGSGTVGAPDIAILLGLWG